MPGASRVRLPRQWRHRRRRQQDRRGQQGQPDNPDKKEPPVRLGQLGPREKREKKLSQGKTEPLALLERLEPPGRPVRLERLVPMDKKTDRGFKLLYLV